MTALYWIMYTDNAPMVVYKNIIMYCGQLVDLLKSRYIPEEGDWQHYTDDHNHLDDPGVHKECNRINIGSLDWEEEEEEKKEKEVEEDEKENAGGETLSYASEDLQRARIIPLKVSPTMTT